MSFVTKSLGFIASDVFHKSNQWSLSQPRSRRGWRTKPFNL